MDEAQVNQTIHDPTAVVETSHIDNIEQEKTLPQSQVNKIFQHEKSKAAQAAKREAEEAYRVQVESLQSQVGGKNQSDAGKSEEDTLYKSVRDRFIGEMQAAQQQKEEAQFKEEMKKVVDTYYEKMASGKNAYGDFEEVTKVFNPAAFPVLSALASRLDNTAEVIYELSNNPSKLITLDGLVGKDLKHAEAELVKLSKSIAANKKAQAEANTNQVSSPLERLQPSKISGSNGKLSIRDLRAQPWLRG